MTLDGTTNYLILLKSLILWVCLIPLAILNGLLRERILNPQFESLASQGIDITVFQINVLDPLRGWPAQQISGIMLCILIFCLCLAFIKRIGSGNHRTFALMGILWAVLTAGFEFTLDILIVGTTVTEHFKMYDITTGNLWILVVIATGVSPWLSARIRNVILTPSKGLYKP